MARSIAEKLGYRSGMTVLTVGRPDGLGDALNLPDNARE